MARSSKLLFTLSLAEAQRRELLPYLSAPAGSLHPFVQRLVDQGRLNQGITIIECLGVQGTRSVVDEVLADLGLHSTFVPSHALLQACGRRSDPDWTVPEPSGGTNVCERVQPARPIFSLKEAEAARVMGVLQEKLLNLELSPKLRVWIVCHLGDIRMCELIEYTERMLSSLGSGLGRFEKNKLAMELKKLVTDRKLVFGVRPTRALKVALMMDPNPLMDPPEPEEPTRALAMTDAERYGIRWGAKVFRSRADVISAREYLLTQRTLIDQQIRNLNESFLSLFPR